MKTDEISTDAAIIPDRLTNAAATITDDDLDYIWQKQELLLGRRVLGAGERNPSPDHGTIPDISQSVIVRFPV